MEDLVSKLAVSTNEPEISELEHLLRRNEMYAGLADFQRFSKKRPAAEGVEDALALRTAYLLWLRQLAWQQREDEIFELEKELHQVPMLDLICEDYGTRAPAPKPKCGDPLQKSDPDARYLNFLRMLSRIRQSDEHLWWKILND